MGLAGCATGQGVAVVPSVAPSVEALSRGLLAMGAHETTLYATLHGLLGKLYVPDALATLLTGTAGRSSSVDGDARVWDETGPTGLATTQGRQRLVEAAGTLRDITASIRDMHDPRRSHLSQSPPATHVVTLPR